MRIKVDGFVTRPGFHTLIEALFDKYNDEIDMMTGVNIYMTPRKRDGTELILNRPDGEPIEIMRFNNSPRKSVEVKPNKPEAKKPPKLVGIVGGKSA